MQTELLDGGWDKIKGNMLKMAHHSVTVGIHDDPVLAQIAQWLEFGTKYIPERPAHRACFEKNKAELKLKYAEMVKLVLAGKISEAQALQRIGDFYAGKLRDEIQKFEDPHNAASTIAEKGFDDPLIGPNADYVNAINPKVVRYGD